MAFIARDLRFAARRLRRTPGFTIVAILTLGTAIGACTAIYSIVYGLVLRLPRTRVPSRSFSSSRRTLRAAEAGTFLIPTSRIRDQTTSRDGRVNQHGLRRSSLATLRQSVSRTSRRGSFDVMVPNPSQAADFRLEIREARGPHAAIESAPGPSLRGDGDSSARECRRPACDAASCRPASAFR